MEGTQTTMTTRNFEKHQRRGMTFDFWKTVTAVKNMG
jgi:hypothetical protein